MLPTRLQKRSTTSNRRSPSFPIENDRSTPGKGLVRWAENFNALRSIGYNGWLVVEAFGLALPDIAAATKIWRRMFISEEQLASDALAFMRSQVAHRWR